MPIPQVHQNPEIHKKLNKQFSDYLEEIVRKIRLGKVFQCNTSKGISLDKIFQAVLVEREFTFYAGYDFYAGTRLNLLDDTQVKNGENSAPVRKKVKNLFMLPGIPDPIPLPIALVTDWRSNQASVKNEKILAIYGMQPSARPGRMPKKAIEKTDDTFHTDCLREKSEHFLELFDRIRFLDNREWEYFPAFFALAFLSFRRRDLQVLSKLFQSKSTSEYNYRATKLEPKLTEICTKITNLSNRCKFAKDSDSKESPKKTQRMLMQEYISMVAFLALIDNIDDDKTFVENILLLDDISGMCTALFGVDIMKKIMKRWNEIGKPIENVTIGKKVEFRERLCKICAHSFSEKSEESLKRFSSKRLIESFCYTDQIALTKDNLEREKIELNNGKCYCDEVGTVQEKYVELLDADMKPLDKLNQMTLLQFDYLKKFGGDFYLESLDSERGRKFKERQTDAKKKILEYYFIFRKEIEEKRDFDFQNVIQAYTGILKGMQDKFLATMKPKPEKRIIWLYKRLLKNIKCNSSVTIKDTSEKNTACLTRKNMDRIYSYASLRWIWVKFFMIRRMQNKEIPVLLRSFCDADQDSLEYRFITSVKISYPYRLWP